jgi:CubicO group peptidase (beta-lactamase class C family)
MFRSVAIAKAARVPSPAMPGTIIRHMLSQPLDFAPGSRYAYSNFGYCLLGRVIEKLSSRVYDTFVRETVLAPMGIRKMRLGRTLVEDRAAGEVKYYTPGNRESDSVFDSSPGRVSAPYGGFCLEAMDSHGGWLASVTDMARFAAGMDALERTNWLQPKTRQLLYAPPAPPASRTAEGRLADHFYGAGWLVRPVGKQGRANYWHNGSLPGTFTLMVRRYDGLSWVALFNQRSDNAKLSDGALDAALHRAADAVATWPEHDLFKDTNL